MPVKYVCKRCGYVLWEFKHVGQDCYGLPSPSEIIAFYGGICPKCKRELSRPTLNDITIMFKEQQSSELKQVYPETLVGGSQQAPVSTLKPESSYTAEVS